MSSMGWTTGLPDQAYMPTLGLNCARKRKVVRGGEVAGIYKDDPIQLRCPRDAHRVTL
jgi:hypothetical protein